MSEIEQLVKMANQIAANFNFHENGAERLADHLRRFWAPIMISQLSDRAAIDSSDLEPTVMQALKQMQTPG
jgi:formate dehydrogenase subunit delta